MATTGGTEGHAVANNEVEGQRLAEYNALRAEILFHLDSQRKIVLGLWTAGSVFFALGSKRNDLTDLLLLVPSIVFAGALHWAHAAYAIVKLGRYIRKEFETSDSGFHWESRGKPSTTPQGSLFARADQWAPSVSALVIGLAAMILWGARESCVVKDLLTSTQLAISAVVVFNLVLVVGSLCLFRYPKP